MFKYTLKQKIQIKLSMYIMPIITKISIFHKLNTYLWRMLGVKIGKNSIIRTGTEINAPFMLEIGDNSVIHGHLKSRGGIKIGNNVLFIENVTVSTQAQNINSSKFEQIYKEVLIKDNCWISINSIILQGVILAQGTIVGAGAVVVKNTEENGVYVGIPAKEIKKRMV
jgi:maltose O-acetyltransferase